MADSVFVVYIHMGPNEWSHDQNGRIMENLAREQGDKHKERPLIVEVYEHAGWWLAFGFAEGYPDCICVGTANDRATFHGDAKRFREEFYTAKRTMLESIRRGE